MRLLFFFLVASLSAMVHAADYINTSTSPLYSGPGSSHPVSHTGLPVGTKLSALKTTKGFTLIKTPNGELGWIDASTLKATASEKTKPQAKSKPKKVKKTAHSKRKTRNAIVSIRSNTSASNVTTTITLSEQDKILQGINSALNKDLSKSSDQTKKILNSTPAENRLSLLSKENTHLRKELQKAKEYINFNSSQERSSMGSIEENEQLRSQLELLQTENQRLQESNQSRSTFNKIFIFLLGLIVGFITTLIFGGRKKKEDW